MACWRICNRSLFDASGEPGSEVRSEGEDYGILSEDGQGTVSLFLAPSERVGALRPCMSDGEYVQTSRRDQRLLGRWRAHRLNWSGRARLRLRVVVLRVGFTNQEEAGR